MEKVKSSAGPAPFVIFLDIDGVLYNRPDQDGVFKKAAELFPDHKGPRNNRMCSIAASYFFDKKALKNLHDLIGKIEKKMPVWIVLSSSWREGRTLEELRETIFGIHKFSKYIVDKTPEEMTTKQVAACKGYRSRSRAAEIHYWLQQHPQVRDYVILDDCDEELSNFGKRFIQTDCSDLLTKEIVQEILKGSNNQSCP